MPLFDITYGNNAFTSHPTAIGWDLTEEEAQALTTRVQGLTSPCCPPGMHGIVAARVQEGGGFGVDPERKVFVSVTVRIQAPDEDTVTALPPPAALVSRVAAYLTQHRGLGEGLEFDDPWEAVEIHAGPDVPSESP
jgi:hypothetical protein